MTELHANIRGMYEAVEKHSGHAPRVLRCSPGEVDRLGAVVQELGLPLAVEGDEECDENLCYLVQWEPRE